MCVYVYQQISYHMIGLPSLKSEGVCEMSDNYLNLTFFYYNCIAHKYNNTEVPLLLVSLSSILWVVISILKYSASDSSSPVSVLSSVQRTWIVLLRVEQIWSAQRKGLRALGLFPSVLPVTINLSRLLPVLLASDRCSQGFYGVIGKIDILK